MQLKYNVDTVITAMERYLDDNQVKPNSFDMEREDIFRVYETLVRVANKPEAVILDDYEVDLLYKYL
jgi:hypothetical protein